MSHKLYKRALDLLINFYKFTSKGSSFIILQILKLCHFEMVFSLVSKNFKLSIDSNNRRKKLDDGDYKYLGYLYPTRWGRFRVVMVSLKIGADSMTSMN